MPRKNNTDNGDASATGISGVNWKLVDAVFKFCPVSAKPNIDWNTLAQTTGHKNGKSARDSFRAACEKFGWFKADGDNSDGAAPASAAKQNNGSAKVTNARKKKAAALKDVNDDASDDEIETPTKKRKGNATNGLETPMKKTKLNNDEAKDEVKDEAKEDTNEAMDVAKDEPADEI